MCGGLYFLLNYPSTCMYTQVPHVDHRQGAEKRRGLELQVVKVAKQGEVEDDPEAHEECPPPAWIIQTRKDGPKRTSKKRTLNVHFPCPAETDPHEPQKKTSIYFKSIFLSKKDIFSLLS